MQERKLAERLGWVRVIFCLFNFGVIALDITTPHVRIPAAVPLAFMAAGIFLVYAVGWLILAASGRTPLDQLLLTAPFLDIACAVMLILTTDGYLSPFNLWMVFAVVVSGFSRYRLLPAAATALGIAAHVAVAQVPQYIPLQSSVFAVRVAYLYGFANIIAFLGSRLAAQSKSLELLVRADEKLGQALTLESVAEALHDSAAELGGLVRSVVEFSGDERFEMETSQDPGQRAPIELPLIISSAELGRFTSWWTRGLAQDELAVLHGIANRAASAASRIIVSRGLARTAAREEREKLADEIHDSILQKLAAIDLRAESAKQALASMSAELAEKELTCVKTVSREAAKELRNLIANLADLRPSDAKTVEELIRDRWPGSAEIHIPAELELLPEAWEAISMAAREGVSNALRHGGGTHLEFMVEADDKEVTARLIHRGKSLVKGPEFQFGLSRLQAVVRAQGGSLSLENAHGGGTELVIILPSSP